jgi:type I restriction enzyme S subunit
MEEWKEYKIGDVCKIKRGASPRPIQQFISNKGMPWVKIADATATDSMFLDSTKEYIKEEGISKSVTVMPGTLIVSNSATPGLPKVIRIKACVHDGWLIISDFKGVHRDFMYYKFVDIRRYLSNQANGSVFQNLKTDIVREFSIKIPSLKTQEEIVSILKSLDDKIEVNRKINENLEQQAQALFKSWFVDFEPFKNGEFVESELGMIPKGWRVKEAQDAFEINIGKTPPRKESEWFTESNEDNVWVSIADMGSCGVFISNSSEYLTDEAIKRFNVQMVEKDSVLLSFKLTVGRVAIADTRLTTNEAIARFVLPDKCYRELLYLYLKQYKYENLGSTSSIATAVNSKTIKGMKLIVPPTEIIKSFSNNTRPLFEQIRCLQQESRRLAELRDTLLPKLMSGELKVNEIEK